MPSKPFKPDELRAARLSRVPGVTLAEACKRFKVAKSAVERARREGAVEARLALEDLALAALTDNGQLERGKLDGLAKIAEWLSYVNQSSHTAAEVRGFLNNFVKRGELKIVGERWELLEPWP